MRAARRPLAARRGLPPAAPDAAVRGGAEGVGADDVAWQLRRRAVAAAVRCEAASAAAAVGAAPVQVVKEREPIAVGVRRHVGAVVVIVLVRDTRLLLLLLLLVVQPELLVLLLPRQPVVGLRWRLQRRRGRGERKR